jgi:hypothetical protein
MALLLVLVSLAPNLLLSACLGPITKDVKPDPMVPLNLRILSNSA